DEVVGTGGRNIRPAGEHMRIVPGEEDDLAAADDNIRFAFEAQVKLTLLHIVVGDDVARDMAERRAVLRLHARGNRPWRREFAFEKDTARETHRAENVRQGVHLMAPM